jgi:uncharacterized membrane protein (UPF0127 family)
MRSRPAKPASAHGRQLSVGCLYERLRGPLAAAARCWAPRSLLAFNLRREEPLMKTVVLRTADDRVVCEQCLLAETTIARMRGLLGRRGLESGEGLLLRPASSIHTLFMRFPIDAVFLGREGDVLKVVHHLKPWRTAAARRAKAVLELVAGEADRRGIHAGIRLDLSFSGGPSSGPAAGHPPVSA